MLDRPWQYASLCVSISLDLLVEQVLVLAANYRVSFAGPSLAIREYRPVDSDLEGLNDALDPGKHLFLALFGLDYVVELEVQRLILLVQPDPARLILHTLILIYFLLTL